MSSDQQYSLRDLPYSSVPIFSDSVHAAYRALLSHDQGAYCNIDELAAYFACISLFLGGSRVYRLVLSTFPDKSDFISKRKKIYLSVGEKKMSPRAEWTFGQTKGFDSNEILRCFLVLGDFLVNPNCVDSYASASLYLQDMSEIVAFSQCMLNGVLPVVTQYCKSILQYSSAKDMSVAQRFHVGNENSLSDPFLQYELTLVRSSMSDTATRVSPPQDRYSSISKSTYVMSPLPDDKPTKLYTVNNTQQRKKGFRNLIIGLLAFAIIMLLIYYFVVQDEKNSISQGKAYSSTATSAPVATYNGKWIILPDYSRVCPLEIIADSSSDYYIYLDYQRAPSYSQEGRKILSFTTPPYESDMAFIVKAGCSLEVDVPIGVYKLYYATGTTFFGSKELFGDETSYYEADELLTFNLSAGYYNGHTITLYSTYGGNFDTDEISEKNFPTR